MRFDEDDDAVKAQVRGVDPSTDVAVLKIDPEAAGGRMQALELAEAGDVTVGDTAPAIGSPFGLERTATAGITSQLLAGSSASTNGGNVAIGFAVPSTTVAQVLPALKAGERITRPYLGVSTAEREKGDGAVVAQVVEGGPGAEGGLEA